MTEVTDAEIAALKAEADGTAAELAKHEAGEAAEKAAGKKPSLGRIVIFRDNAGVCAPAIVTLVDEAGGCALHVFRHDAGSTTYAVPVPPVKPDGTDSGWFWPPRV